MPFWLILLVFSSKIYRLSGVCWSASSILSQFFDLKYFQFKTIFFGIRMTTVAVSRICTTQCKTREMTIGKFNSPFNEQIEYIVSNFSGNFLSFLDFFSFDICLCFFIFLSKHEIAIFLHCYFPINLHSQKIVLVLYLLSLSFSFIRSFG